MISPNMNFTSDNSTKLPDVQKGIEGVHGRDENLARFEIATLAVIFLVTVIGNTTVLLALWSRRKYAGRKKLSRMYFFILHLSIADLLTAFFSVLPQLAWDITYRFEGGWVLCKLVKLVQLLGPYLSSYILMATAIDRHQAICYPLTYCSWTSRRSKVMVYLAWTISLLFCIPQLFIFSYMEVKEEPGTFECWAVFSQPWGERAYVTWYCISIFIVPLIVLVVTYTCICREIWKSSDLVLRSKQGRKASTTKRIPLISRAKINTVKQTIAVIVMYIVCSAPFIFALLYVCWHRENPFGEKLPNVEPDPDEEEEEDEHGPEENTKPGPVFTILSLLYSLNSCVNPWIYLAFNRELPRLLLRHCTASSKNYTPAAGGYSASNSSGEVQTTTLRPFSRWSFCNSSKSTKYPARNANRPHVAQYNARRWIVTTTT